LRRRGNRLARRWVEDRQTGQGTVGRRPSGLKTVEDITEHGLSLVVRVRVRRRADRVGKIGANDDRLDVIAPPEADLPIGSRTRRTVRLLEMRVERALDAALPLFIRHYRLLNRRTLFAD
jgi:hypothetical protein